MKGLFVLRSCLAAATTLFVLASASARADDPPGDLLPKVAPAEPEPPTPASTATPPAPAPATSPPPTPAAPKPLDVREPPFADKDFSWLNGSNRQPESLLHVGPTILSLYVDVFYAYQFNHPIDHTIFPTTVAPRFNEIGLNLASVGIELPPNAIDSSGGGPIGQFSLQYGDFVQAVSGQDTTVKRGFFLANEALQAVRTASAGWHFHVLHGVNLEFGVFPSYMGMESYLPQENWNYTHPFVSDFTPYYFYGGRAQMYLTASVKLELWVVNGWQTYGQWQEAKSGGYLLNWRPTERLVFANIIYIGQTEPTDPGAIRYYTDNFAQFQYFKNPKGFFTSSALCVVADGGYQSRTTAPSGGMTGYSLTHRTEFGDGWAVTLRGDLYYDPTRAVTTHLPIGSPYTIPDATSPFLGDGFTTTLDYLPSPWLLTRLEYSHRVANVPFFSGPRGITGNGPDGTVNTSHDAPLFTPDLVKSDDRIVANVTLRL
jgi:putative OmpL-like beta-barrel porin-2